MLADAPCGFERVSGCERHGPAVPGFGPIINVISNEQGMIVIRFVGGRYPTAAYLMMDGDDEWRRLWVQ